MNNTLKNVGNLGGIGVAGQGEAVLLEEELGGADVALFEHGELTGAPRVVGATISAVDLLGQLGCQIDLHCL